MLAVPFSELQIKKKATKKLSQPESGEVQQHHIFEGHQPQPAVSPPAAAEQVMALMAQRGQVFQGLVS